MPRLRPIPAIRYPTTSRDLSTKIAPPYDVLDETSKADLLTRDPHNIVRVDLPHLPAKTVGPDATYEQAGELYRQWLAEGVLEQTPEPRLFAYQQTYDVRGRTFKRRGLIANVVVQPFGPAPADAPAGTGGIFPHEETFSGPKLDRFKLMTATQAQLSPIFGLYSDPDDNIGPMLARVIDAGEPSYFGRTANDQVLHEVWEITDPAQVDELTRTLAPMDTFIADGHHRYNTALNYKAHLLETGELSPEDHDHPANGCLFVLVAMEDPGMIILPTHRVLGGMTGFSLAKLKTAANGHMAFTRFDGADLSALEAALPDAGPHAMGLYAPGDPDGPMWIAATPDEDPLLATHGDRSEAWRRLDVAIVQHLLVERICQPAFCDGGEVTWKFPHALDELKAIAGSNDFQLGVLTQATPLASVRDVSEAGELMPQKSTFFYPKVATGLAINPLTS